MTSRRSMKTPTEKVSRALQFIPGHVGGRVASAQPVLRRERIGVAGATPPAPDPPTGFSHLGHTFMTGTDTMDWLQLLAPQSQPPADTVLVALAHGGHTYTPPTGWTTLASGTNGPQDYWLGWLRCTGTDTIEMSYSGNWDTLGYVTIVQYDTVDPAYDVAATAVTTSTAASIIVPAADPAWAIPCMLAGFYNSTGNVGIYYTEDSAISGGSGDGYGAYGQGAAFWRLLDVAPTSAADLDFWTDGSHTTPSEDNESLAVAYGFIIP